VQAYSENIAKAYSRIWGEYGEAFGKKYLRYLASERSKQPRVALDLACGTGSVTKILLRGGLQVVAVDGSRHMLAEAEAACTPYRGDGYVKFVCGDIRDFTLDVVADIGVLCYDAINHLGSLDDLDRCFRCMASSLAPGGILAFDLKTIRGLRDWDGIKIKDSEDYTLISRGFFDQTTMRASKKLSGYYALDGETYERFEQMIFNRAFAVEDVVARLHAAGFTRVEIRDEGDFSRPVADPEQASRVVALAHRDD
jgi:SAM-dependent methyltransferase